MASIVDCFHIGKYAIVKMDKVPNVYSRAIIDGKEYRIIIPYDIPNAIAVESAENFKGCHIDLV